MTFTLLISIIIQISAVVIIMRNKKRWFASNGVLLILISVFSHGFIEIIQRFSSSAYWQREVLGISLIDRWLLIVSVSMLVFSLTYAQVIKNAGKQSDAFQLSYINSDLPTTIFNWRILGILCAAIYPFIFTAYMFDTTNLSTNDSQYWISGIATEVLLLLTVLLTISLSISLPPKWIHFYLGLQSFLLFLTGQRLPIIYGFIAALSCLYRYNYPIHWKRVFAVVFLGIGLLLGVSYLRTIVGREALTSGSISERVSTVISGTERKGTDASVADGETALPFSTVIDRADGNIFGALMLAQFDSGLEYPGFQTIMGNLYLIIPRYFFSNKFDSDIVTNEEAYLVNYFQLSIDDYNTLFFPMLYSYYGFYSMLLLSIFAGYAFAKTDLWLQRSMTLMSVLISVGLTYCIIFIEQGIAVYFILLRKMAFLYIILFLINKTPLTRLIPKRKGVDYSTLVTLDIAR